jgi:hypothetical protein
VNSNKLSFKLPKLSMCLTMLAFFGTIQASALGTKDGGGGNLCYIGNKPVLLEFADLSPELNEPGMKFESSDMVKVFGFGNLEQISRDKLDERVRAILNANYDYSPFVVSLFRNIMSDVVFSFTTTNIRVPVKADVSAQPNCQHGNVKASVVYLPSHLALADLEKVNSLDLDSQAGMVLHEAARFFQTYQENGTDLELQNMIRTMFDVYKGRSRATLDTDKFYSTFNNNLEVYVETADLCMDDYYFYSAGVKVFNQRGEIVPRSISPHFTNIGYEPEEIQKEILAARGAAIESSPAVAKDACNLKYKGGPWREIRAQLQSIQQRLSYLGTRGENQEALEILKTRVATALANPSLHRNWKAESMSFIERESQFSYNRRSQTAEILGGLAYYLQYKNDRFLSEKTKALVKDIPRMACSSRANVEEWLRLGAANLRQYEDGKIVQALFAPNPKCK